MLDVAKIKSAEPITDVSVVADRIARAMAEESKGRMGAQTHTTARVCEKTGRVLFGKVSGATLKRVQVPTGESLQELVRAAGIAWTDEFEGRAVPYWASDERVDGHGDIVRQRWHFDEFRNNPVIPFGHEWENPPIGNAIEYEVRRRKDAEYDGAALYLLALFATEKQSARADGVFRLIEGGFLKASSVGFYSDVVIDVKDEDERAELGLGRWGFILDENHLLEMSPVTIPANDGAGVISCLSAAKARGRLRPVDLDVARELVRSRIVAEGGDGYGDRWRAENRVLRSAARTLFPTHEFKEASDVDEPVVGDEPPMLRGLISGGLGNEATIEGVAASLVRIESMMGEALAGLSVRVDEQAEHLIALRELVASKADGPYDDDEDDDDDDETMSGEPDDAKEGDADGADPEGDADPETDGGDDQEISEEEAEKLLASLEAASA